MNSGKRLLVVSLLALLGATSVHAQDSRTWPEVRGGVVTLYTLDPVASTLCFYDGRDGEVIEKGVVYMRCGDMDFDAYNAGAFTVGVQGGKVGRIIDLGSAAELKDRYGYQETVGNGQGYASIRREGNRLVIRKRLSSDEPQELKESAELFQAGEGGAKAPVRVGHIYVLRLTDPGEKGFERVVKMLVLAHTPGESVTIRWQAL